MKLRDTHISGCDDPAWELIPWYVNGSLPNDQAEQVEAHGKTCTACAAEIGRQRELAQQVATVDPFEAPLARSWESLRTQIAADAKARAPQPAARRWFAGLNGGVLALMGTVAAACVVVVVQVSQPSGDDFVTLTSGSADAAQLIKFQPAPGLAPEALTAVLAGQGATLVSGPTDTGVYTATLSAGADATAVADVLMAQPEIIFAAPEAEQ